MKFLLDQNISFRVAKLLEELSYESVHVSGVGLKNSTDFEIWNYAQQNDYIILTHDIDFDDISARYGFPPKIIRLNTGNMSNKDTADLIFRHYKEIESFSFNEEIGLMVLTKL